MPIKELNENLIEVFYNEIKVGDLSRLPQSQIAFSYDKAWLAHGFSISPFSLPLRDEVFIASEGPHYGLFGVFADSIADGWGALLLDRKLAEYGIHPQEIDAFSRLTLLDSTSLGALSYKPTAALKKQVFSDDFDILSKAAQNILSNQDTRDLDELFAAGGSSGGARPKAHVLLDGQSWIVKFFTQQDGEAFGKAEYEISLLAQKCGITVSQAKLLPSRICSGFFATKRFDRITTSDNSVKTNTTVNAAGAENETRIHMISAAGLFEISHRDFNLTYEALFQAVLQLGIGLEGAQELFRRMVFNVVVGNQDDHAKNFSFLYDEATGWQLSPAYDLTRTTGYMGERATTINGKGKNITLGDLLTVAEKTGLKSSWAKKTAHEIEGIVEEAGFLSHRLS